MRVLKSNIAALIATLFAVVFIIGLSLTAVGKPDPDNPGQPFNQIEAKLDKLEAKLDRLLGALPPNIRKLEAKLDRIEETIAGGIVPPDIGDLIKAVAALETKLDRRLPGALPPHIQKLEAKLDKITDAGLRESIAALEAKLDVIEAKLDAGAGG